MAPRLAPVVASAAALLVFTEALTSHATEPSSAAPSSGYAHAGLLDTPLYFAPGVIGSVPLEGASSTFGVEATLMHWTDDTPGTAFGGFAQLEHVGAGDFRVAVGPQLSLGGAFGAELGYAYESALDGQSHVHGVQCTPFFSLGAAYVGVRAFVPVAPKPVTLSLSLVLGLKIPVNVGRPWRFKWLGS
jgi:hypothetical protein